MTMCPCFRELEYSEWLHYNTIVFLLQRVGIREGGFTVYSGIFISEGFGIEDLYCSTLMLFVRNTSSQNIHNQTRYYLWSQFCGCQFVA